MTFGPSDDSLRPWTENARFWVTMQGDLGSLWQREAIAPAIERLLAVRPGERVLELCCGNGGVARRLAKAGAHVVASDGVPQMIDLARARSGEVADAIEWRVADVTRDDDIAALGPGPFDAAVFSMAAMDVPDLAPIFRGVRRLVTPRARFVVATLHPCFCTPDPVLFEERRYRPDGSFETTRGLKISRYLTPFEYPSVVQEGQSVLQPCYHRPLGALLAPAFDAGWTLDAIEEPGGPPDGVAKARLRWNEMREMAPMLVVRLVPRATL